MSHAAVCKTVTERITSRPARERLFNESLLVHRALLCVFRQMLWELRAEPLAGTAESVLVEMRQVPGYLDFLAEIMPADVRKAEGLI